MAALVLIVLALIGLFVILPTFSSIFGLVISLLVWAAIGWLAGKFLRGRGYGAVGNILLGVGGGILGGLIFQVAAPALAMGLLGNLLSGVVGAIALVYVVRLLGINPSFGR